MSFRVPFAALEGKRRPTNEAQPQRAMRADAIGLVGPQWLLFAYLLHTIGELMLSPIGLSMVTKLAPARLGAMMMGLWFTSTAIANYLAGILEALLAGSGIPLYWFLVATSISGGVVLLSIAPLLTRLARGREATGQ